MVKCYGRRLVLCQIDDGHCRDIEYVQNVLGGREIVESIEDDIEVSILLSNIPTIQTNYSLLWQNYGSGKGSVVALLDTGVSQIREFGMRHFVHCLDMISDSTLAKDGDCRDYHPSDMGDSDPELCPVPTWH
jgi:hypothetical protein